MRKVYNYLQTEAIVSGLTSETTYTFKVVPVNECAQATIFDAEEVTIKTKMGPCHHGKCTEVIPMNPPVVDVALL